MDFIGYECDGCKKPFHADDDIVVCPVCGTPQHRECYEKLGHCVNEEKHAENYSWEDEHNNNANEKAEVKCPVCGFKNPANSLFCNHCGQPLNSDSSQTSQENPPNTAPFGGFASFGGFSPINEQQQPDFEKIYDSDAPIADEVTVKEMTSFVDQNKPYYYTVFNNIKWHDTSRYNFAAFLFTGGWFLYRKQYLKGAIICIITIALLIISALYANYSAETMLSLLKSWLPSGAESYSNMVQEANVIMNGMSSLGAVEKFMMLAPFISSVILFVIRIICGTVANRSYYTFAAKKIRFIKGKTSSPISDTLDAQDEPVNTDSSKTIELIKNAGGVNRTVIIIYLVCYLIIEYLPYFLV